MGVDGHVAAARAVVGNGGVFVQMPEGPFRPAGPHRPLPSGRRADRAPHGRSDRAPGHGRDRGALRRPPDGARRCSRRRAPASCWATPGTEPRRSEGIARGARLPRPDRALRGAPGARGRGPPPGDRGPARPPAPAPEAAHLAAPPSRPGSTGRGADRRPTEDDVAAAHGIDPRRAAPVSSADAVRGLDPRSRRPHAARPDLAPAARPRPRGPAAAAAREARDAQPRRLRQGPDRPADDRGRRARRPPPTGRHHHRADVGQHRPRPGHRGRAARAIAASS